MQKELECTKIKDGLYLGNIKTAQDAEFLITNKFAYVVNCAAEIPNYFEADGFKYLKFKLVRDKTHQLWGQSLKKLKKLHKFVSACQQNSMCLLIHSYDGTNRSLAMLVAFVMYRYRWRLTKTLQFVRSKQIFIGLSDHYIEQLESLEHILGKTEPPLSVKWRIDYTCQEEEVISKTFINSQEIESSELTKREKKTKRIVWKDQIEGEQKKWEEHKHPRNSIQGTAAMIWEKKNQNSKSKKEKKDIAGFKRTKNKNKGEGGVKEGAILGNEALTEGNGKFNTLDEEQIIKMIKKNLKSKKRIEPQFLNITGENEEKIYNVTINNYIKPNINILNHAQEKKKAKQRPQSAWSREPQHIGRTHSEKEGIKSANKDKSLKNINRRVENSPRRREKKTTKANSMSVGKAK